MERSKRRDLSSAESVEVILERSAATSVDNCSEATRPIINLREDRKSTRAIWRGRTRSPEGQSTSSRQNETERLLTTANTVNQVPQTPNNPNNQITVSYKTIVFVCSVLVVFLTTGIALSMQLYHQSHHFENEKKQLGDAIEEYRANSSQILELREKVFQLSGEKQESEIRKEYLQKDNKKIKDQNLVLNEEVVGLREAVTQAKYQLDLNLTVERLTMQYQEQLDRQRLEDKSQMETRVQEMAKNHNVEMDDMVQFVSCLLEDDFRDLWFSSIRRMFSAYFGSNNNVEKCMKLISDRIRHRLK